MPTTKSIQDWQVIFAEKLGISSNESCTCGKLRREIHCPYCGSSSWYTSKRNGQYDSVHLENGTYTVPVITCKKCSLRYNLVFALQRCRFGEEKQAQEKLATQNRIVNELIRVKQSGKFVEVNAPSPEEMAQAAKEMVNATEVEDESGRKAAFAKMFGLEPTDVVKTKNDESS